MNATNTLHAIIQQARQRLERAGIHPAEAAIDAEVLARHALGGWERAQLVTNWREPTPAGFVDRYNPLVQRRERREPTAYITGHREFWGLDIEVGPGVLIPRPETEFIVEEALARVTPDARPRASETTVPPRPRSRKPPLDVARGGPELAEGPAKHVLESRVLQTHAVGCYVRIADVGTGSGCLAVSLAHSLPEARVVATDVSADALTIAARNISRHDVRHRVSLLRCELLQATAGPFDCIVSNPPYIPTADLASLQPEILGYEPRLALDAGPDGLDLIRRLVPMAASRLVPGGWLIFEFGDGQASGVQEIITAEPHLAVVALRDDLAGIPRVAVARRTWRNV
ncbi:MAG: peptide chain release factor N(5)-glutamine methyltransferase [Acidobacteria bacterium]|nr:peptide chain release factor N(5)-glutamine methyltransferase [Acidobacteriota bacterium]